MRWVHDQGVVQGYLTDASNITGHARTLLRPNDASEVSEALKKCAEQQTPVTVSGARTATTGSATPQGGAVLSMEKMNRIITIDEKFAVVEPGVILGDLQNELARQGLMFPPDPTSRHSCTIGGAISTNASGACSYKYGPTREWIHALEVVTPNGDILTVSRETEWPNTWPKVAWERPAVKNSAGYYTDTPLDLFIGSEGTLGVVTKATLKLIKLPHQVIGLFVYFASVKEAVSMVTTLNKNRSSNSRNEAVSPRCIEYLDRASLDLAAQSDFDIYPGAQCAIYMEQEIDQTVEIDHHLQEWLAFLDTHHALTEETVFAESDKDVEQLHDLRHSIPARINEIMVSNGFPKVGTDSSTPLTETPIELAESDALSIQHLVFGHIGDNHLHLNFLPATDAELKDARRAVNTIAHHSMAVGGSFSAEHGVGKIKRTLFAEMVGPTGMAQHRALKIVLDPNWILGCGNLFLPTKETPLPVAASAE